MFGFGVGVVATDGVREHGGLGIHAAQIRVQLQRLLDAGRVELVQHDHLLSCGEVTATVGLSDAVAIERRAAIECSVASRAKRRQALDGPEQIESLDQPLLH